MTDFSQLHTYLQSAADSIRSTFAAANLGHFHVEIEISGPTHGSEQTKISYKVSRDSYERSAPTGARLQPVLVEYLRRHNWKEANDPAKTLPAPSKILDDEIPF